MAGPDAGPLVHVAHPSPVRHLPPGCRVPREAYERLVTPARLALAEEAEFAEARGAAAAAGLPHPYGHDGAYLARGELWQPLRVQHRDAGPVTAVDPAEFRAFLASPRADLAGRLAAALRWTPLVACPAAPAIRSGHPVRHDRGCEAGIGRVVHEERERSAAALRAFLGRDVLLTPVRVFMRVVACRRLRGREADPVLLPPGGEEGDRILPFAREVAWEAARVWDGPKARRRGRKPPGRVLGEDTDADIVAGANILARRADVLLAALGDRAEWLPGRGARDLRAVRDGMGPWLMRGRMGTLAAEDAEAFLVDFLGLRERLAGIVPPGELVDPLARLEEHVRVAYLPRLRRGAPATGDDLAALDGLAA